MILAGLNHLQKFFFLDFLLLFFFIFFYEGFLYFIFFNCEFLPNLSQFLPLFSYLVFFYFYRLRAVGQENKKIFEDSSGSLKFPVRGYRVLGHYEESKRNK